MAYFPPQPKYIVNFGDGSPSSPSEARSVTHRYSQARQFEVSAIAEVGETRIQSNQQPVTITDSNQSTAVYQVNVDVPSTVEVGKQVKATALANPEPGNGALYSFVWGDGQRSDNQTSSSATHTYAGPAITRYVYAILNIDGRQTPSNRRAIRVIEKPPTGGGQGADSNNVVTPPNEIAVPELYWLTPADANAALRKYGLRAESSGPQDEVVIRQDPEPGILVRPGSNVSYSLGQPELLLSANDTSPKVNEEVSFTVTLEPPLPERLQATYTFNWGEGPNMRLQGVLTASHNFNSAGTFKVSATAQVGAMNIPSNEVAVAVQGTTPVVMYTVSVQVSPDSAETRQSVQATAFVRPKPPNGAEYSFVWGDKSPQSVPQPSPDATHSYDVSRIYFVQAIAKINGQVIRSNPAQVQITLPPAPGRDGTQPITTTWPAWQIAVVVGIALLVVGGGLRFILRSAQKPTAQQPPHRGESLSITSGPGLSHHVIQHAEQLGKMPSVRVRAGCKSRVAVTSPQAIIKKKRSASNA